MPEAVTRTQVRDIEGTLHLVSVRVHRNRYIATSLSTTRTGEAETVEEAVEHLLASHNHDCPKQFELESIEKQQKILTWINKHFKPGKRSNSKRYSSSYLKQVVERGIGEYVSNGELKGAMLKTGYSPTPQSRPHDLDWDFVLQKLPERHLSRRLAPVSRRLAPVSRRLAR
jgi:hypothetical protein